MATLEDAAEDLVAKLQGLDSEIEESEQALHALRERVEDALRDVQQESTALAEAASSFLEKAGEGREQLREETQETLQALSDAHVAVARDAARATSEVVECRGHFSALGEHAASLEPGVNSLATKAGEAPAERLAERGRQLEQELADLVQEATTFLRDEVAPAVESVAAQIQERCDQLHQALTEEAMAALQETFDQWESTVADLEDYVISEGYEAAHGHTLDVVEYAAEEGQKACEAHLDALQQTVGTLIGQLRDLASEVEDSATALVAQAGAELTQELERTQAAAARALAGLDRVKQELASYSFVEV